MSSSRVRVDEGRKNDNHENKRNGDDDEDGKLGTANDDDDNDGDERKRGGKLLNSEGWLLSIYCSGSLSYAW